MGNLLFSDLKQQYLLHDMQEIDLLLKMEIQSNKQKIIVLDDDPTGVQTVHNVSVFTDWTTQSIKSGFHSKDKLFFILTNSRSFTEAETIAVHKEIAENIAKVSSEIGKDYLLISRGDSTLRGHYPLETEVLKDILEENSTIKFDGEIICPFFNAGGRFTVGNVHYVLEKDLLVPAGETEFAKDKTFGFKSSHLGEWIEEKTNGTFKSEDVIFITLDELRSLDFDGITEKLLHVEDFKKVVVNALDECDIKVFSIALYRVLKQKKFLFRTAASFVKAFGGISSKPLLQFEDLITASTDCGGLIIVGSHTKKTTAQLGQLQNCPHVILVEFNQHLVVESDEIFQTEINRVSAFCHKQMKEHKTVCISTRRERFDLNTGNKEDELKAAVKISDALTSIVSGLTVRPRFIIAKGGITSSDVGTKGLGVKCAVVAGQIKPGIPVWICGNESKFPQLPYIIFPGNVGEESTLKEIVESLIP